MKNKIRKKDLWIKWISGTISVITIIILGIWGISIWRQHLKYETTNDAQVEMYINPINSRVTGYIREIKFEENQLVHKGDTLVIIDNSDYKVQLDAAKANANNGVAQVEILDEQIANAQQDVAVNQTKIQAAKAKLELAQSEYNRYKDLYDMESATKQQLENKLTNLTVAKAEYASVVKNVSASEGKVNAVKSQKSAINSEIERRNAITNQQNLTMSYTVITAPYDGKMGRRNLQVGQLIQLGQTIAYIVDLHSGKWIIANYKETQMSDLNIGNEVDIEIDAIPETTFKGVVESFSAATGSRFSVMPPDNSTGNFVKTAQRIPVKIRFKNNQNLEKIFAGMNVITHIKKSK
ncbi:HlyD family secretion protein [Cloacibacterium sp.]|uniref:HlyD family secretion protein n=1 Tax=Cloacibacterium sp. TaxID=1913682 RepID=UPI0039E2F773